MRISPEQYFENLTTDEKTDYLPWFIIGTLIFGGICIVAIAYSKRR